MVAISTRQPEVKVAYRCPACKGKGKSSNGRTCRPCIGGGVLFKHFEDAHKAKQFYVKQFRAGNKPSIVGANTMATSTKTTPRKRSVKTDAKKKGGKGTKKTAAKKTTPSSNGSGLSKNQVRILQALSKSKGEMTYGQIRSKTGIQRGLSKLVAATTSTGSKYPDSLEAKKCVKLTSRPGDGTERQVIHVAITQTGKKLLAKA